MSKKFTFYYDDNAYKAAAQAFHEDGMLKYRVGFEGNLVVVHQLLSSIASPSGPIFVQETEPDEPALPDELIHAIGWILEEVEFFPGSFWIEYNDGDHQYFSQFVKDGNTYKMVYCFLPDMEGIPLPAIITKQAGSDGTYIWEQHAATTKAVWFDQVVQAIEEYERQQDQN